MEVFMAKVIVMRNRSNRNNLIINLQDVFKALMNSIVWRVYVFASRTEGGT
jgi:hypothetical protein